MLESVRDRTDKALQSHAVPAFIPETKLPVFRSRRTSNSTASSVLVLEPTARFTIRRPPTQVFFLERAVVAMRERAAATEPRRATV